MRILIVSEDIPYPNMGGLAKHVLNLSRALVRAGHEVDLLGGNQHPIQMAGEEGIFGGRFFGELDGHLAGWKEIKLGMFLLPRRKWVARHFARIIMRRANDYDVIHYHGHIPNVARYIPTSINFVQTRHDHGSECLISTRFRNNAICEAVEAAECAHCMTQHPNLLQRAASTMAVTHFRKDVAEGFRRHKTIFVSNMLRQNYSRTMGPGPWGAVVHNFVDVAKLQEARNLTEPALPGNEVRVFIAGKFYSAKGIEPFLRELVPRLPENMRVTLAGDGIDEERLRAEFEGPQIRFLGWCSSEETLKMAARAHAIVVPSVWEDPCPTTIFEGLLLGKMTFALERGGTPELAIYAAAPSQLRLHSDMQSLVTDLVSLNADTSFSPPSQIAGSSDFAAEKLVRIYRQPPGRLTD